MTGIQLLTSVFQGVLFVKVPEIIVKVKDFDFSHVIRFFNRLDDVGLKLLPGHHYHTDAAKRKMIVRLELTKHSHLHIDRLRRWIKRSANPAKKGAQINAEYDVVGGNEELLRRIMGIVEDLHEVYGDHRQRAVLVSMHEGLRDALRGIMGRWSFMYDRTINRLE